MLGGERRGNAQLCPRPNFTCRAGRGRTLFVKTIPGTAQWDGVTRDWRHNSSKFGAKSPGEGREVVRAATVLCVACAARPKTLLACLPRPGGLPLLLLLLQLPGWLVGLPAAAAAADRRIADPLPFHLQPIHCSPPFPSSAQPSKQGPTNPSPYSALHPPLPYSPQ